MSQIIAVLGPTNTGKTFYAIDRMLAHSSGMIGLPLRLLAREVYDKVVAVKGVEAVALVTGEERIWPDTARYFVSTVEAMPLSQSVEFMAVDEIQLAADPDRGHTFTHRILHARGRGETLLLGAETMRPALKALGLKIEENRRERFSDLSYVGPTKVTKLPRRSAIVAFSAEEVYALAELLRRQRGGAAVVMGGLSPRTRNAQVDLYQSGEVDYLVATDAIGMGLNLDVDHIAFASRQKFDGRRRRRLTAAELGQIAGRAGRYRSDGTFGETADCPPFEEDLVQRLETHQFEPVEQLWWRNAELDFSRLDTLLNTLSLGSGESILRPCNDALDEQTLRHMAEDEDVKAATTGARRVRRLWDLCTLPDFRQSGTDGHFRLIRALWDELADPDARISCDWMEHQMRRLDTTEGEMDQIQQRLASIRTWTYAANRQDWVEKAETWRGEARAIEDRLSDALHERLTQRFVDRRTTALIRGMKKEDALLAGVGDGGEVTIEGHSVGRLEGLTFKPDINTRTLEGKAVRNAAFQALKPVLARRLADLVEASASAFALTSEGRITFDDEVIARLKPGPHWLRPSVELIGGEQGEVSARERAVERLKVWLYGETSRRLPQLSNLHDALDGMSLQGMARGLAFQVLEAGAVVDLRRESTIRIEAADRTALKDAGIRAGRVCAYAPEALKPAQQQLVATLKSVALATDIPAAPAGAGSFETSAATSNEMLSANGYLRFGGRAVRADLAERLAWEIDKKRKEAGKNLFELQRDLASIVSCPGDAFEAVLKGYDLVPAEKDDETGQVKLWRFRSRSRTEAEHPGRRDRQREAVKSDGHQAAPPRNARRSTKKPNRKSHSETSRQRRDGPIDPNSPFAELAALFPSKAQGTPAAKAKAEPVHPEPEPSEGSNKSESSADTVPSTDS